jgi:hypothetical protein
MPFDYEYGEIDPADQSEEFTDFDQLLDLWNQYLHREMQSFKVFRSDMYGSACVCDLKTIFLEQNFTPEYIMTLIPRTRDCYTSCLSGEYNKYMSIFLSAYTNISGEPMTISDLGSDEPHFFQMFLNVVKDKAIFNAWDLWSTKKRAGN